jgi:hypothetical protein
MSLTIENGRPEDLLQIPLFYIIKRGKYNAKKVIVLTDEEGKKMLEDETKKKEVQVLNTTWKPLNWEETLKLREKINVLNPQTGQYEISLGKYNDILAKTCLINWDYVENGSTKPVSPEIINKMLPDIVGALVKKFENATALTEEEEGK